VRGIRLGLVLALCALAAGGLAFGLANSTLFGGKASGAGAPKRQRALGARNAVYQELAALTASQDVFRAPGARPFELISARRPITGEQTVLPVLGETSRGGIGWLQVQLPGRPNGLTGWIRLSGSKLEYTPWRIVVNTARRRVYAYDAGHLMRSFEAVVGAPATPTPKGQFFVEENVALSPSAVGYPYAVALSSRSNVIQEFAGGPGQIALHGLDNVGGTLGTAVSHGCIRLDTSAITWLAKRVDPGVPVTVY
jgi:hypothetical protein